MEWRMRAAILLLSGLYVAGQRPGPPIMTWYKPDKFELPGRSLFEGGKVPLATATGRKLSDNTPLIFVMGAANIPDECPRPSTVSSVDSGVWTVEVLMESGYTFRRSVAPDGVVRLQGATAVLASANQAAGQALCTVGGMAFSGGQWQPTARVMCAFDAGEAELTQWKTGFEWKDQAPLPAAILGASLVQGPFGTWLVGGMRADRPGWCGILSAVWSPDGKSISGWVEVAPITPLGPRLYPAVTWSQEAQALYAVAGQTVTEDGSPIIGADESTDPVSFLWKLSSEGGVVDPSNSSAWDKIGRVPEVRALCFGAEPEALMFEVVLPNPALSVLPYPKSGLNLTAAKAEATAMGWVIPSMTGLAYATAGQMFISTNVGAGWMKPDAYVHPTMEGAEGTVLVHSLAISSMVASPREEVKSHPWGSVMLVGVGAKASTHKHEEFLGQWNAGYPFTPCLNPCGVNWKPVNPPSFSTGCRGGPTDALCHGCDHFTAPHCELGVQMIKYKCGASYSIVGHQRPEICKACSGCPLGYYASRGCTFTNDTECTLGAAPPPPPPIPSPTSYVLPPLSGFVAIGLAVLTFANVIVGVSAVLLRLLGSRTVRAACVRVKLPPAPKKSVQDWAVYAASVSLSFVAIVFSLVVGGTMLSYADASKGPINLCVTLGTGILLPAVILLVGTAYGTWRHVNTVATSRMSALALHTTSYMHPRNVLVLLLACSRQTTGKSSPPSPQHSAGSSAGKKGNNGAITTQVLRQLTAWTSVALLSVDLCSFIMWFASVVLVQPLAPPLPQATQVSERQLRYMFGAVVTGSIHALASLMLTVYAISRARVYILTRRVTGEQSSPTHSSAVGEAVQWESPSCTSTPTLPAMPMPAPGTQVVVGRPGPAGHSRAAVVSALMAGKAGDASDRPSLAGPPVPASPSSIGTAMHEGGPHGQRMARAVVPVQTANPAYSAHAHMWPAGSSPGLLPNGMSMLPHPHGGHPALSFYLPEHASMPMQMPMQVPLHSLHGHGAIPFLMPMTMPMPVSAGGHGPSVHPGPNQEDMDGEGQTEEDEEEEGEGQDGEEEEMQEDSPPHMNAKARGETEGQAGHAPAQAAGSDGSQSGDASRAGEDSSGTGSTVGMEQIMLLAAVVQEELEAARARPNPQVQRGSLSGSGPFL